ncbi:MAG TPA: GNAT family N-acetyltransferase [Streptosporangiaceae bacterium]|nr:GNAT family N-acetyltransferase [Streptosporangiaceae bacterium]
MGTTPDLVVRPLSAATWPALEDLFGRAGASNGCWCMYPRIGPEYRKRPRSANKQAMHDLAAAGRPPGLIAFSGEVSVGWCQVAPRSDLAWLARRGVLPAGGDQPAWAIGCFYTRRSHRGQGVPDALIAAAVTTASAARARVLDACPVDTSVAGHTTNLFPGVAATFARHGFEVIAHYRPDRPVMRLAL